MQQHLTLWVTGQRKSSKTIAPEVEEEVEDNVAAPNPLSSDSWGDSEWSPTMKLYNYYSLLGHTFNLFEHLYLILVMKKIFFGYVMKFELIFSCITHSKEL